MNRGRKPRPCPNYDELRAAHARDPRVAVVARLVGSSSVKQVRRWLAEIGIYLQPARKQRSRDTTPRFVKVGLASDGRRIWTKLYGVWNAMRGRCNSPGTKDYKRYGARGIRVCAEWDDFDAFRSWALSHGFKKGLTLDRKDSDGDYGPDNCRFIPKGEQQDNIRRAIRLTLNGETRSLYRWARITGLSADMIRSRVYMGWTDEQTLTTPRMEGGQVRSGVQHKPRGRKPRIAVCSSEEAGTDV